jgi:hypothetical protein
VDEQGGISMTSSKVSGAHLCWGTNAYVVVTQFGFVLIMWSMLNIDLKNYK